VYNRLAGYEDTNDAVRLVRDPVMQAVVGHREKLTFGIPQIGGSGDKPSEVKGGN